MKLRWIVRGVCTVILLALAIMIVEVNAQVNTAQSVNLLQNSDFEEGFHQHSGIGELTVADNWSPWYSEEGGRHRPEYKAEIANVGKGRVYHGDKAQKQFTTFAPQDGGIYQQIHGVTPGKWYTFSAWVYVWSSNHDDPDTSNYPGKYSALVGINPWGDTQALYRTTVWGKEALEQYDHWVQVSVTAQAWSNKIVVFTRGDAIWGVKHNDSYWDYLSLAEAGGPSPTTPTPYPTPGNCPSLEEIRNVIRNEIDDTHIIVGGD